MWPPFKIGLTHFLNCGCILSNVMTTSRKCFQRRGDVMNRSEEANLQQTILAAGKMQMQIPDKGLGGWDGERGCWPWARQGKGASMISRGRRVSGMPATKNSFSRWQVIQMKCHSSHRLAVSAATNVHYPYLNLKEQIQSEFLPLATLVRTSLSLAKTSSQASKLR